MGYYRKAVSKVGESEIRNSHVSAEQLSIEGLASADFMYRTFSPTGGQMYPKEHKSTKYRTALSNEM